MRTTKKDKFLNRKKYINECQKKKVSINWQIKWSCKLFIQLKTLVNTLITMYTYTWKHLSFYSKNIDKRNEINRNNLKQITGE